MAGSPRIIARPTTQSPAACRRARVRQGRAFGGAEEAPSLTAAARDGNGNMRSGRKNARGAGRTKEWRIGMTKEDKNGVIPIDKESPIQAVCIKVHVARGNSRSYRDIHLSLRLSLSRFITRPVTGPIFR